MITLTKVTQTIVLTAGNDGPVTIARAVAPSLVLQAGGPPGPIGSLDGLDLPDFALIFENRLV